MLRKPSTRKDIPLPLLWPLLSTDGHTPIFSIPLKKNTNVIISILGANRCTRVWGPDADEWKPERWLSDTGMGMGGVGETKMPGIYSNM